MIEVRKLVRDYPDFHLEVDFHVEEGELVSILGPSGSGKTTTLRLIGGFERPDSGSIVIGGRDATQLSPAERGIGFVFQDYTLFPHLDVEGNIAYGLRHHPVSNPADHIAGLLRLVGLEGYNHRGVHTLSGGERQRVALARALAIQPDLLALDEPFSSIDTPLRRGLRREILRLQRELGVATLFVTHSQEEALSISDRVAIMRGGRIEQFDTPEELYYHPSNRFVAEFVGAATFFPGRITAREKGKIGFQSVREFRVSAEGAQISGTAANSAVLLVRPDKVRRAESSDRENRFRARVLSSQYFGHYYEVTAELEGITISAYLDHAVEAGTNIELCFAPDDALILPSA
jgi:ABC-type Fe3+/spermidine/putrescine transport system ATPase subunit